MVFTKVTKFQRIINYSVRKSLHNIDTAISLTIYAGNFSLPVWQAVKMILFAPCKSQT